MSFKFLDRLVELLKEDEVLKAAILELIDAKINAENALADYRRGRTKK